MTMGFSEFGRRVAENGTGTDHGAGGLMFLSGSAVAGGLASGVPGLPAGRPRGRQREGDDGLPLGLPVGARRVARR